MDSCMEDMRKASAGEWTFDAQVRIYDFLAILKDETYDMATVAGKAADFLELYAACAADLERVFDAASLLGRQKALLAPLERACTDARFEAAAAASLHEFARQTYETWETAGIFMKRRALKALRERAGFRLESHRIGNYVAKTFDLMNEAQVRFARTQQSLFSSDVSYKIQPGLHQKVADALNLISMPSSH